MKPKRVRLVRVLTALSIMLSLLSGFIQTPTVAAQGPVRGRPPVESRLVRAHPFTGDLRNLPRVKPVKQERPEIEEPEANPIPFPDSISPILIAPSKPSSPSSPGGSGAVAFSGATVLKPDQTTAKTGSRKPILRTKASAPDPIITFDGLDFATWGAGHPPDTNGDVGPTYYIQTVNTSIGIYTKTTGSLVTAFTFNMLMSQGSFGNLCDTNNFGDPVVLYDTFEDRWIITDFAFTLDGSNNVINPPGSFQCFAVSRSGNPVTGGWNFYSINTAGGLGDYPKFGIWPDGLYMSTNMFDYAAAGSFQDARVYAFNKTQMYSGASSVQVVSFDAPASEFTLLPANARLQTGTPPAGSPNYYAVVWQYTNAISVYKFHVDWNSISTSTFTGPFISIAPASWVSPPATVPASTGGNALDTLAVRLMVQNQYTNIGGIESLWDSHTVRGSAATNAAPRFYQVTVTGGTVAATTIQAFTHNPDASALNRWMPSIAVDRSGDMAIGYSASNATTFPSLRYVGRLFTDTLSTLPQTETILFQGTGTQSGSCGGTCTRWGDYSAMTLDPDGCTFWYTNEYYGTTGLNDLTRIGSFKYPSCTIVGSGAITGTVIDAANSNPLSGTTVTLGSRITTTNGSGIYQFLNIPAGVYPSISASYSGYSLSSAGPITVTENLTTTQNFALSTAAAANCYIDTTQADFQTGVPTNCDLTSSPGNVTLLNAANIDQQNTSVTTSGFGFNSTSWAGQTFQPAVTGQLTRMDLDLFCSGCTGTTPNLTVSIRATSADLPTGADLAVATIPGFSSGAGGYFSANFSTPATLTTGTRYAVVFSAVSNPSAGTYAYVVSTGSPYANGRRVTSANSGSTWTGQTTDIGFKVYMQSGYSPTGTLVSSAKDANPAVSDTARWTTLSWNATTPANTSVKFQAAASNNPLGPFTFVGPDGTASTYFTTTSASLSQFDGLRYLKYTAYFTTTDSTATPTLADVTVCFNNIAISPTVWNGNTDTNWFVAGNWNPASVPTAASDVIIPTAPSGNRWPTLTGTTTIYTLTLQSSAALTLAQGITLSVNGAVTNDGALAQIKDVPASAMTEFLHITDSSGTIDKYHGVDLTPGGTAMGVTTVQVKGNQSACTTVPADPIIQRCYRIDPTTQTTATVRFWFTEAERNAQSANNLKLWHWGPWTQVGTAGNYTYSESGAACLSGSGQACWFQSTGVTSYSPFAVGSTNAPTAITLRDFSAISSSSSPVFLIAVILAAATAIGAVAVSRKKRRITLQ